MDYLSLTQNLRRQIPITPQFTVRVADNGIMVETILNGQRTRVYSSFADASEYMQTIVDGYYEALKKMETEDAEAKNGEQL